MTANPPGDTPEKPENQLSPAPSTPVNPNGQHQTHDDPVPTD
ncbi:hypothetical protein [Umezawaea sp.]